MSFSRIVLSLMMLVGYIASAEPTVYPGEDWQTVHPNYLGMDLMKLREFEQYAFRKDKVWRSDSVLVIYKGRIVFERYENGFDKDRRHLSWSMAKSFTTTVFGIAESMGYINRNDTLAKFYSNLVSDPAQKEKMNAVHLMDELTMSSGRQWIEDYTVLKAPDSDVVRMLYLDGHYDMAAYVASRPLADKPGERYLYDTGSTSVVMGALKQRLGAGYSEFPFKYLFNRIGMKNVTWEQDQAGTYIGGASLYATPRDYARLGYLLMKDGKWNDDQVVPKEWIDACREVSPGLARGIYSPDYMIKYRRSYGAGFWLNKPVPHFGILKPYPGAPDDLFQMIGHEGQTVIMIPSLDLLVVRTAHDDASAEYADTRIDWNTFLQPLIASLPGGGR